MSEVNVATVPILPYPQFLSPAIQNYIGKIAEQAGRHVLFIDLRKVGSSHVQAEIQGEPNRPAVAICVDTAKINPSKYAPAAHDPLIAHEITHLQLWSEGWSQVECDVVLNQDSISKVTTVANWLTDPVINRRIRACGFDMTPNRTRDIKESIQALRKGAWSAYQTDKGIGDVEPIRFFVSF